MCWKLFFFVCVLFLFLGELIFAADWEVVVGNGSEMVGSFRRSLDNTAIVRINVRLLLEMLGWFWADDGLVFCCFFWPELMGIKKLKLDFDCECWESCWNGWLNYCILFEPNNWFGGALVLELVLLEMAFEYCHRFPCFCWFGMFDVLYVGWLVCWIIACAWLTCWWLLLL